MNRKKSFILYFDNLALLKRLQPADVGRVVLALAEYARRLPEERSLTPDEVLPGWPEITPEGRMVFYCMADCVARDTEKWLDRRENCQEAARKRQDQRREKEAAASPSDSDGTRDEDIYWARKYRERRERDRAKKAAETVPSTLPKSTPTGSQEQDISWMLPYIERTQREWEAKKAEREANGTYPDDGRPLSYGPASADRAGSPATPSRGLNPYPFEQER